MSSEPSPLGPVNPNDARGGFDEDPVSENEKAAPWVVRKLAGSMTGRIVMSSYESLRAAGTSVICLSPWGDSSPLLLPCIRFRDLAVHTVVAATGGLAAVASPFMGPLSDAVVSTLGDTVFVELGVHTGFELSAKAVDSLIGDKVADAVTGRVQRAWRSVALGERPGWETTGVKEMTITLRYKGVMDDAALGFYRSSVHRDNSLFATVKDYLAIEKGWFSPYLFASGRRPDIPRSMRPDVIFCHGPFLEGDYKVGETLLTESAFAIELCVKAAPPSPPLESTPNAGGGGLAVPSRPSLSSMFARSRTPSPEPTLTALPSPPAPRRMVMVVVGLLPHRKLWTTSARPGESVIGYVLLNGCPAVVVPVRVGTPLVAWDALTLAMLWKIGGPGEGRFEGVVNVLCEYLDMCVDWGRVLLVSPGESGEEGRADASEEEKRSVVRDAVRMLVGSAVKTKDSRQVKKEVDEDRCGIAMWRIP